MNKARETFRSTGQVKARYLPNLWRSETEDPQEALVRKTREMVRDAVERHMGSAKKDT